MEPGFKLNLHDREKNPCFESHDPSMMYDPVSGMYYSYSTDAAVTSAYRQGIPVRRSRDLVHFEFVGCALSEQAVSQGRDNGPGYEPTFGFCTLIAGAGVHRHTCDRVQFLNIDAPKTVRAGG